MTTVQWMFEYHALRKREAEQVEMVTTVFKSASRTLRALLVSVLGLQWRKTDAETEADASKGDDAEVVPGFMPLSFLVGRPEMVQVLLKDNEGEEAAEKAIGDEAFDEWSKKLASGDLSDLEPILATHMEAPEWDQEAHLKMMESMGISIVNKPEPEPEEAR